MTDYSRTIEAVRAASQDLADETWQGDDQMPGRDIRAGRAVGNVRVYPHPERGATVTIELDGLTAEQAIAVLRTLTERHGRVTYDIPSPEVGRGR